LKRAKKNVFCEPRTGSGRKCGIPGGRAT
jgi:hypothetical protein